MTSKGVQHRYVAEPPSPIRRRPFDAGLGCNWVQLGYPRGLCILHLTLYTVLIVLSTVWVVFHFEAYTATFVISANENELMKGTLHLTAYSLHLS